MRFCGDNLAVAYFSFCRVVLQESGSSTVGRVKLFMASGGCGGSGAAGVAEDKAQWLIIEHWSHTLQQGATVDRSTLMVLYQNVAGGYLPKAWLEKHWPAVARQLTILQNHKAAVDRAGLQWSWEKYVQNVSQKAELSATPPRSRSPMGRSASETTREPATANMAAGAGQASGSASIPEAMFGQVPGLEPYRQILKGFWDEAPGKP